MDYFVDNRMDVLPFTLASSWEPDWEQLDGRVRALIQKDVQCLNSYLPTRGDGMFLHQGDNNTFNKNSKKIIKTLQQNPNIIIKPADKGSKIVIMDKQQYAFEAHRQLTDEKYYKPIEESLQTQTQSKVQQIIQTLYKRKYINAKQRDFLSGPTDPRNRRFYLLPKIHKEPSTWTVPHVIPPGRPIVSDCSSVTYNVAMYIDSFLGPLSSRHPSYLKDTYHFLETIRPMILPSHALLFTIDIDSLYTNINTEMGLKTIKNIFLKYPDRRRPDREILELLEICLKCNDFEFDNKQYLQVEGTAMGHRYAPSYANLYMSEWEREALEKCPFKPLFYLRFLDDIIGAWQHGEEKFKQFISILNNHHPSIKVKYSLEPKEINFLDTTVFFEKIDSNSKKLLTRVYFKSTDTHALLHKTSYHPKHTFRGIVKSQIIRFHRISSRLADLENSISILFRSLTQRGYSRRFLRSIKSSTLASLAPARLEDSFSVQAAGQRRHGGRGTVSPEKVVPLVTTYSLPYLPLQSQLKTNFRDTMANHCRFKEYRVISALRKNKNLRDMLVKSKFCRHPAIPKGDNHWAFRPKKFLYNPQGGVGVPIIGRLTLQSQNVVYCIGCGVCGMLYVGETGKTLLTRLKQHLYNIREGRQTTPLVQHFQIHSIQHLYITGLQTCGTWTEGQRRRKEALWMEKLKTRVPYGLNLA